MDESELPHTGNWMSLQESERLAKLWCAGQPLDDLPQWRTAMHVLMRELHTARAAQAPLIAEIERLRSELDALKSISQPEIMLNVGADVGTRTAEGLPLFHCSMYTDIPKDTTP
jgi:hypothetical protein